MISEPYAGKFELPEYDMSLIDPFISRLGPGGIPWELMSGDFTLDSPSDKESDIQGLMARVYDFGHRLKESDSRYNQVQTGDVMTTPLVYDAGASTNLTPFSGVFLG